MADVSAPSWSGTWVVLMARRLETSRAIDSNARVPAVAVESDTWRI